jgi:hypothetical protein
VRATIAPWLPHPQQTGLLFVLVLALGCGRCNREQHANKGIHRNFPDSSAVMWVARRSGLLWHPASEAGGLHPQPFGSSCSSSWRHARPWPPCWCHTSGQHDGRNTRARHCGRCIYTRWLGSCAWSYTRCVSTAPAKETFAATAHSLGLYHLSPSNIIMCWAEYRQQDRLEHAHTPCGLWLVCVSRSWCAWQHPHAHPHP